jgi:quercetin dioxygenase-like cupin family protein
MKQLLTTAISLALLSSASAGCAAHPKPQLVQGPATERAAGPSAHEGHLKITRGGSRPTTQGPAENFTGSVVVEPLFGPTEHTRASGASVTFEPGARSAWHSHPAGQTLIVTSGAGWVQEWGGEKQEIKSGDVIWTPPGVKHWHGASATRGMTHLAIQENVEGKVVDWMEQVTDEQYRD